MSTWFERNAQWVEQGLAIALIALAVLARLAPHPPNFTPISAIALFGGVYLARPYAVFLPVLAMFASDMIGEAFGPFAGFSGPGFHDTMLEVYGSFVLVGLIGLWVGTRKSLATIIGGSLAASVLFYLVTNFAVWHGGSMYQQDISGLMASYTAGIPFFRNTLLGDLFFTSVLFGAYEVVRSLIATRPVKQPFRSF